MSYWAEVTISPGGKEHFYTSVPYGFFFYISRGRSNLASWKTSYFSFQKLSWQGHQTLYTESIDSGSSKKSELILVGTKIDGNSPPIASHAYYFKFMYCLLMSFSHVDWEIPSIMYVKLKNAIYWWLWRRERKLWKGGEQRKKGSEKGCDAEIFKLEKNIKDI